MINLQAKTSISYHQCFADSLFSSVSVTRAQMVNLPLSSGLLHLRVSLELFIITYLLNEEGWCLGQTCEESGG